ncbi:hypothetical protein H6P81_017130 [Aristolochia fimbriata]|uniref:Neprosin PEP catalytic domain-containing protein n=1 Tax=Aristolochia fimbriata TaxID=158543 RepID=A0AAV7DYL1_ARIFI|nr:hypothetical protein H6P81_017130 [Aristolochia fimbriata]
MALKAIVPVFTLVFAALIIKSNGSEENFSREEDLELERQLKMLNKPAIKTIKTEYGDIFDCVDIYEQPAFDHPLLKNHKIQMIPSFLANRSTSKQEASSMARVVGLPDGGCPQGSVPIRRTNKEELRNARKFFNHENGTAMPNANDQNKVYGTRFVANVWGLQLEEGQANCYKNTGCYNTLCSGFVQIDTQIPLGAYLEPLSVYKGPQYEIHVEIYKDLSSDGNWWLVLSDNKPVGYWPFELFSGLPDHATNLEWGGYVHGPRGKQSPPMGSGHFSRRHTFGTTCFVKEIHLMDNYRSFYDPKGKYIYFGTGKRFYQQSGICGQDGHGCSMYFGGTGW